VDRQSNRADDWGLIIGFATYLLKNRQLVFIFLIVGFFIPFFQQKNQRIASKNQD